MISIPLANWLFAILFLLVFLVGGVLQTASAGWGLLATEVLLILLPLLLVYRVLRIPVRKGFDLSLPSRPLMLWSLLSGIGLGLFSQWLLNLTVVLLGYSLPTLPQLYPQDIIQAAALAIGLLVAAPVCEEMLFRGAIMRAYRRWGSWTAILFSAALFAIFHSSLQRFLVLIPLGVLTGFVAWRLQSVVSSMLLHAGYNLTGTLAILFSGLGNLQNIANPWLALLPWIGLLITVIGIIRIRGESKPEILDPAPAAVKPLRAGFGSFSAFLPFILVLPLFLIPAASEVISGKYPERLADPGLTFRPERWSTSQEERFELRNILNQHVGEAVCSLILLERSYHLDCRAEQEAFEAEVPGSYFNMQQSTKHWSAEWSQADGQLTAFESVEVQGGDRQIVLRLETSTPEPVMRISQTGEPDQLLTLDGSEILPQEWPWRLLALPVGYPYRVKAQLASPALWSQELQKSIPIAQPVLVNVSTSEPVDTPAGRVICWKVQVGNFTAHYSVEPPYRLIRYNDGVVSYVALGTE